MTVALALALLLTPPGFAQDPDEGNRALSESGPRPMSEPPWKVEPYWEPVSELRSLFPVQGSSFPVTVQLVGGVSGGLRYRYRDGPHWYGYSRLAGTITYSITHGGLGLDGRVGSFFGFDDDLFRVTTGPDFFINLYSGSDYTLPAYSGLGWDLRGTIKPLRELWVIANITPAWMITPLGSSTSRIADLGPFHEMEMGLSVFYFGQFHFQVGWLWTWKAYSATQVFMHGPVISVRM
ncbi:MAG: hypothetical protein JRJ84_05645 [Deltaproteobacteria bacterium]|nr:hypothetical protein [Deltaproteobacteria bacterium]